ncbi:MAG TPA: RidA family protein [Anaerolineales bacterium]|nr:RidA family protein [Anaerolineales bacterium]
MEIPEKEIVITDRAPKPIGPYSAGVQAGQFVFTAGQIGLDPESGELVPGGIAAETRQALDNIENILHAAGSSIVLVVKTTVFLRDMADFGNMNAVYGEFFREAPPARSTVQVAALPRGAAVEIEAVAILGRSRGD